MIHQRKDSAGPATAPSVALHSLYVQSGLQTATPKSPDLDLIGAVVINYPLPLHFLLRALDIPAPTLIHCTQILRSPPHGSTAAGTFAPSKVPAGFSGDLSIQYIFGW